MVCLYQFEHDVFHALPPLCPPPSYSCAYGSKTSLFELRLQSFELIRTISFVCVFISASVSLCRCVCVYGLPKITEPCVRMHVDRRSECVHSVFVLQHVQRKGSQSLGSRHLYNPWHSTNKEMDEALGAHFSKSSP